MKSALVAALLVLALSACGDGDVQVARQDDASNGGSPATAPLVDSDTSGPFETMSGGLEALPGVAYELELGTHCGVEALGMPVNDTFWITDEANGSELDWMPIEWSQTLAPGEQIIALEVVLSSDETRLTATKAGRSVVYRPVTTSDPEMFCA